MGLFSAAKKESQIGIDFLPDGLAVAQVQTGKNNPGGIIRSEFVSAAGQEAQVEALTEWVSRNGLHKTPCVCLVAGDDCTVISFPSSRGTSAFANGALPNRFPTHFF